jgi:arylsulfatase
MHKANLRETIMWRAVILCVALASVFPLARADQDTPLKRPNIVVILADDMGFSDLGCYGSEIATPNLDRLAADGLRFTQFYNTARCCPSRAALLTGLYPHQAGVGHMNETRGRLPAYRGFLNNRCLTIAEVLRTAGYQTAIVGKWHVGDRPEHWPARRGFDESYAFINGATNYFRLDPDVQLVRNHRSIRPAEDWYITDAITDNAIDFLDKFHSTAKPFFLYVAYTAPHWPLHAHAQDITKYQGKYTAGWDELRRQRRKRQIEMGVVDARWPLTTRDPRVPAWEDTQDKLDWDRRMAVYAAQVDRLDQDIGRVLTKLKEIGAGENTLVMFLSDNGGCAEVVERGEPGAVIGTKESYTSYGIGWANASNTPFRLYKHWVHEGGIATPFIARWPAGLKHKGITHEPGHLIDIMATCVDIGGAKYPQALQRRPITPLEGQSLRPIFEAGKRTGHEALFWEHEGNRAIRQGRWKLVAQHQAAWELYDLQADRSELHDLAAQQPDKVRELSQMYGSWAKRIGVVPWGRFGARQLNHQ